MHYMIDRFEKEYAVLEDENKRIITILRSKLPAQIKEGDYINDSNGCYEVDKAKSRKRKEEMQKKLSDLFFEE